MRKFTPQTLSTVATEGLEVLEQVRDKYGFIPNLMGNMAQAPAAAKAYLALGNLMGETSFDATEQQVILLATSRYNECEYCMGAHSAISAMQMVPADVVESIRSDQPIENRKLEALREFTTTVVDQRGVLSRDQTVAFLSAGYSEAQILEVILGVAMKTVSNYTNHIAQTDLDPAFADYAWQSPSTAVA